MYGSVYNSGWAATSAHQLHSMPRVHILAAACHWPRAPCMACVGAPGTQVLPYHTHTLVTSFPPFFPFFCTTLFGLPCTTLFLFHLSPARRCSAASGPEWCTRSAKEVRDSEINSPGVLADGRLTAGSESAQRRWRCAALRQRHAGHARRRRRRGGRVGGAAVAAWATLTGHTGPAVLRAGRKPGQPTARYGCGK